MKDKDITPASYYIKKLKENKYYVPTYNDARSYTQEELKEIKQALKEFKERITII